MSGNDLAALLALLVVVGVVTAYRSSQIRALATSAGSRGPIGPLRTSATQHQPEDEAIRLVRGEDQLKALYEELRDRPGLVKIQAIWAANYENVDFSEYFKSEQAWLDKHPDAIIERIVVNQDHHLDVLEAYLEEPSSNLSLYTGRDTSQFELFLCEFPKDGTTALAGVITVKNALHDRPEFGILLDGTVNPDLTPLNFTLRKWFEAIPRQAIEPSRDRRRVWNDGSRQYDALVGRSSRHAFLRQFIREEDACLKHLLLAQSKDVAVVEFGVGTARTFEYLADDRNVADRVKLWIGIDDAEGMIAAAQDKRAASGWPQPNNTYFFSADASSKQAYRSFFFGQFHYAETLNDRTQMRKHQLDSSVYANCRRVFTCLLNTLGVMDYESRKSAVENMVTAATLDDLIVVSTFDADAFAKHARPLYEAITSVVGTESSEYRFDNANADFRAAQYRSHWFARDELEALLVDAGAEPVGYQKLTHGGQGIGHFFTARRRT